MMRLDCAFLLEVRDGPGDLQYLIICPCRYAEFQYCEFQDLAGLFIHDGVSLQFPGFKVRVEVYSLILITLLLYGAGPFNAPGYLLRRLAAAPRGQVFEIQPRHLNMYVYPVEERARDLGE